MGYFGFYLRYCELILSLIAFNVFFPSDYLFRISIISCIKCGRFPDFNRLSSEYHKCGGVFDDGYSDRMLPLTPLRSSPLFVS